MRTIHRGSFLFPLGARFATPYLTMLMMMRDYIHQFWSECFQISFCPSHRLFAGEIVGMSGVEPLADQGHAACEQLPHNSSNHDCCFASGAIGGLAAGGA